MISISLKTNVFLLEIFQSDGKVRGEYRLNLVKGLQIHILANKFNPKITFFLITLI